MNQARGNSAATFAEEAMRLRREGREQEALAAASQALKIDPSLAAMWDCIGFLLLKRGRWKEAEPYLRQGVERAPNDGPLRSRLAIALMEQDRLEEAFAESEAALKAQPGCADALLVEGEIMCRRGRHKDAIPYYRAAYAAGGIGETALFSLGAATFLTGGFEEGLGFLAKAAPAKETFDLPDWQGETDPNLHLLLCGEYGFGDILHFIRYARDAQKRVGTISFLLPDALVELIADNFPDVPIIRRGDVLPRDANARCFYMDLPHVLGPPFDPKASKVPYLRADEKRILFWQEKLKCIPYPRIAFGWAGNPLHQNDRNRSLPFAELMPLIELAKPHLISLQRDGQDKVKEAGVFDATPLIADFSDSAALLKNVDLLITIDSAPAHLGGALGLPVWTLLPFNPDWRWLLGRSDCIWYPTMTLYRQEKPRDWEAVVAKICGAVATKLGSLQD